MEWINSQDKLPDDGQWVLAAYSNHDETPYAILQFIAGFETWRDESGDGQYRAPDFWLPLAVLPALPAVQAPANQR